MPSVKSNLACAALVVALQTQPARAQGDLLDTDGLAEAIVAMTSRVWTGPRTPAPRQTERPSDTPLTIRSPYALLEVHANPDVDRAAVRRALSALEHARSSLDTMGWPSPLSDGDRGGGAEWDLYLTGSMKPGGYSDGLATWSYLDRASTFAVLSPTTPAGILDACVTEAYADALLMSLDPAEAKAWRRATAAWLAWEVTGRFGCDDAVAAQQSEPFRSWVGGAAGEGAGGALLLAYLSARHDPESGRFVRDVWGLASQRTWEGDGLRADPDLWSATEIAVERSGDRLLDNVEELAVIRWLVGRSASGDPTAAALDDDAKVPVYRHMKRMPTRIVSEQPLAAFGTAYMTMDSTTWADQTKLRAWLRGEYGVRWSFIAVQLDAGGGEVRRLAAPRTASTPKAYLPIEVDERTRQLLFVVTSLSNALPDADEEDVHPRSFELIVDGAGD
jgi:hypothetical protein